MRARRREWVILGQAVDDAAMFRTAFFSHPDCLAHSPGPDHPECPGRVRAIDDRFWAAGLFDLLRHPGAERAYREQLERVHQSGFVQSIFFAVHRCALR